MAIAFVSFSSGTSGRNIEIVSGTTLLVVGVCRNDAVGSGTTASLGATTLDVANNANDWTQVHYIIDPPVGTAAVAATGTNITNVFAAHYSGDLSFSSAAQGSVSSHSFSPTDPALMVFAQSSSSTSHTPLTNNTERYDVSGDYFCDRIESSGGTYSVGVSSSTAPDSTAALFVEAAASVSAGGTPTAPAPTVSGTATVVVDGSGTPSAPAPTVSGTASVVVAASGTPAAPAPTVSGSASVVVEASGAPSAPAPTVAGTVTVDLASVGASGSPSAPAPTVSGTVVISSPQGTATARVTTAGSSAVATSDPTALAGAAGSSSVSASSPTAAVQAGRGTSSVIG